MSETAAAADRDHSLILAQVLGARGQAYVTAVYTLISRPKHVRTTAAAMTAWATLGDGAAEREIDQLTEQFTEIFAPILAELTSEDAPGLPVLTDTDLQTYGADHLTASQLEVLGRLQAALLRADDDA